MKAEWASIALAIFLAKTVLAEFNCEDADAAAEGDLGKTASIIILVIYGIEWFVLLFPNLIPLARPASSMLGAVLCLLTAEVASKFGTEAFNAFCFIDYDTLALLFGLMLIVVMIDESGILVMIEMKLESKVRWWFITKVCFVCAVLSAIVMNDTICLFFTKPILEAVRKHPKMAENPLPYLLALSSNSNIGSALTVTGNPQNAMIGSIEDTITYYNFLVSMAIPCVLAWLINWLILLIWYRHSLGLMAGSQKDSQRLADHHTKEADIVGGHGTADNDCFTASCGCLVPKADKNIQRNFDEEELVVRKDTLAAGNTYKLFLVIGIVLMIIGFFVGINVAGISVGFGVLFMCTRTVISSRAKAKRSKNGLVDVDSEKYLESVDWSLLILFTGLFIMISATVQTGYPDEFFRAIFDACKENPTDQCTYMFAFMIVLFSNIISNVPLILLIKGYIGGTIEQGIISRRNWLFISWVCTLAGNFILLGSAANLIVADQARQAGQDVLTTINHGKFGIPSTFACLALGIPVLTRTMI